VEDERRAQEKAHSIMKSLGDRLHLRLMTYPQRQAKSWNLLNLAEGWPWQNCVLLKLLAEGGAEMLVHHSISWLQQPLILYQLAVTYLNMADLLFERSSIFEALAGMRPICSALPVLALYSTQEERQYSRILPADAIYRHQTSSASHPRRVAGNPKVQTTRCTEHDLEH